MSTAHLVVPILAGGPWEELVGELGVGVLLCDGAGGVRAVTSRAADLLGLTEDELASGDRPSGWLFTDERGAAQPDLDVLAAQVLRAGTTATVPVVVCGHRRLWLELYPVELQGSRLVLAVLRPVHAEVWWDKGLRDPVTGLPNRVLLFDRLDQALRRARVRGNRVSLVLADVRGLHDLGPGPGDRVLGEVGDRLTGGLDADHTVARYGGGTFAVVVDHPHGTGARVAARVAELAPHPVRVGWVTSDGADSVHDLVTGAHDRLGR